MATVIDGSTGVSQVQSGVVAQNNLGPDVQQIGVGQTWQDVTVSRAFSTTYTNSTGKPIFVSVVCNNGGNNTNPSSATLTIDGIVVCNNAFGGAITATKVSTAQGIVPAGSTYSATGSSLVSWTELR